MEAPQGRMSPEEFEKTMAMQSDARYQYVEGGGYRCKNCGSEVLQTTLYVSVHSSEFGDSCAGSGKVVKVPLPYCPKCEGEPKNFTTCIHIPMLPLAPLYLKPKPLD